MNQKQKRVLGDYKKVRKKFISPWNQSFGDSVETSFIRYTMPELLWIASLNKTLGWSKGNELCAEIVRHFSIAKRDPLWLSYTSAIEAVPSSCREELLKKLSAQDITDLRTGLDAYARVFSRFPLGITLFGHNISSPSEDDIDFVKELITECFGKRGTPAVRMQANAFYAATACGKIKFTQGSGFERFPEIENHPHTDESLGQAAMVCSVLNMQTGFLLDWGRLSWAGYFWNRGLQLEPIDYSHLYSDDDNE